MVVLKFGWLLAAIALTAALYYHWQLSDDPAEAVSAEETPLGEDEPDVLLHDAIITEFETDGALKYSLSAARMERFDDRQLTRLTQPTLDLRPVDASPWDISSLQGFIRYQPGPDGQPEEVVFLLDDVHLKQRYRDSSRTQLSIRSDVFYIYPARQFAETDHDVMIDSAVGRTTAAGMSGDLQLGLLDLVSNELARNPELDLTSEQTDSAGTSGRWTPLPPRPSASETEIGERVHTIVLPQQFKERKADG